MFLKYYKIPTGILKMWFDGFVASNSVQDSAQQKFEGKKFDD